MKQYENNELTTIPERVKTFTHEGAEELYEKYSELCLNYPYYGFISRLRIDPSTGQEVLRSDPHYWTLYTTKLPDGNLLLKVFLEDYTIIPGEPTLIEKGGFHIDPTYSVESFGLCEDDSEEKFSRLVNPDSAISAGGGRGKWINDGRMLISSLNGLPYYYYNRPFDFHTRLYGLSEKFLQGKKILDIGSGGGNFVTKGASIGLDVIGMDVGYKFWKPDGVFTGEASLQNFIPHDWYDIPWPFEDESFDLIIGTYSIFAYVPHYLNELDSSQYSLLISEIKRVSKKKSSIYGTTDLFGIFEKQVLDSIKKNGGNVTFNFANAGNQRHRVIRMHF